MILIFAVDGNWKIGLGGQMLVEIEEDCIGSKRLLMDVL